MLLGNSFFSILFPDSHEKRHLLTNLNPSENRDVLDDKTNFFVTYFFTYRDTNTKKSIEEIKRYKNPLFFNYFGKVIAKSLVRNSHNLSHGMTLIPIPQTNKRLKERGYDVTLELCKSVARALPEEVSVTILNKTIISARKQHQSGYENRKDRIKKSYGMFTFQGTMEDSPTNKIILVDDVYTTGASLIEAKRLLGENEVIVNECYTIAH